SYRLRFYYIPKLAPPPPKKKTPGKELGDLKVTCIPLLQSARWSYGSKVNSIPLDRFIPDPH
ncbi:MAG: hypothetical protein ACI8X5_003522, partial [Planctomycetota bacterium]